MKTLTNQFQHSTTKYHLGESLVNLGNYVDMSRTILVLDENVDKHHAHKLPGWKKLVIPDGEEHKAMDVLQQIIDGLIALEADRKTMLVGIGGGMVTDLTGFAASIYMRGIPFGFVPSTLLAQVDASIGGKNGINHGQHKNMLGTINQPSFILFDYTLPATMPDEEWHNGFAEIIKYACILDVQLFDYLEQHRDKALARDVAVLEYLVERSVELKTQVVLNDEFETGQRRWLNFGHTLGHAVEKLENIAHGKAVAIGMVAAAKLSEKLSGLPVEQTNRLIRLINDYQLPVTMSTDKEAVFNLFKLDKKRDGAAIHFVLLKEIGQALTQPIPIDDLKQYLQEL
ncbi:3-dehydroquinate synthase [Chitinophaga pendula]|uniref:3-dehydroquinate synthase n=1 Tax=Chitinophaga TaxID=79328 RepID=UPI000BAEAEA8|nr:MULTISPECIES: 3-dehydroquinate synthase [Chitinophaga]ASZ11539.1 3-dehydroquinate synthase [Chitinophaga sp. MD30]UCJ05450.1 3-dehydroquinate synthase [Chitinophaga pendula]